MNHKRRKPRRKVKCVICTDNRDGNKGRDKMANQAMLMESEQYADEIEEEDIRLADYNNDVDEYMRGMQPASG